MYILLILLAFILLSLSFFESDSNSNDNGLLFKIRLAPIKSFTAIALISYLICELLSLFNILSFNYVVFSWALINAFIIYFYKELIKLNVNRIISYKILLPKKDKNFLLLIFIVIILPLFLLSIFIPPNNWDSMAYHLPRVEHWIKNKNIYPYPTNIVRQIVSPPLSEYIITNFQILSNTDTFSNLVQFASFILILFASTLIFSCLKISFKGQLFLLLALLGLPMLLFQATTTQTDLLASFFFLAFILFSLLIIQSDNNFKSNFTFLALTLCLGALTKYHIAIFAFPIVIYLLFNLIKKKNTKNIIFAILIAFLSVIIILAPLFARNIYFLGSITGKDLFDNNATIINSSISFTSMLSNNLKHFVDFVSIPINGFNELLFSINHTLHTIMGISENAAGNNWAGEPFRVNNLLNEDTAGSFIHAIFIIASIFLVFKIKQKIKLILLFAYCFIAFSSYALLFRYTPFDIRLLLPVLILLIIISAYTIYTFIQNKYVLNGLMILFFIIAIFPVYFNTAKPIIANPFYLRRTLISSPKGNIDNTVLRLIPSENKEKILTNYILIDSSYFLKKGLTFEQREALFNLQDSIGLFYYDKRTIFQKSRIDNYYALNPYIQKNMDTLFDHISKPTSNNNINKTQQAIIDLNIEFDSFEYLIWVYAKANFKNGFYIGNSDSLKYKSYSKNSINPQLYNIEIVDKNKNWTIKFKN
jgi:hypothetical protein